MVDPGGELKLLCSLVVDAGVESWGSQIRILVANMLVYLGRQDMTGFPDNGWVGKLWREPLCHRPYHSIGNDIVLLFW